MQRNECLFFLKNYFANATQGFQNFTCMPAKPKPKTQPTKASSGLAKAAKASKPANKTAAKAADKAAPTVKRKPTTVKAPAKKTPMAPAKAKAPKESSAAEIVITTDEIALRAYYIAERRRSMGWGGDEHSDWVEAESQLKAEAKRKR